MKNIKKILAVLLAVMMVAALSVTALATGANSDGTLNDDNGITADTNVINIAKQIVFVNAENTNVREPNIVYTYTIATTAPGTAKITDKNSIEGTVKAGPLAAVTGATTAITSTITFADTNTKVEATANGTNSASKYATFTFDASKFKTGDPAVLTPGIYRYKITESCNPTKASVGITEAGTFNPDRFLDVYVKWNDARTALEVYGYALFEGSETQSIKSDELSSGDVSMKSKGYVDTDTNASDTNHADVDVYTTQNLHISKVTTGSLADKTWDFPVTITFTKASGLSDGIKMDFTVSGDGTLTKTGTDTNSVDYVTMDVALNGTVDDEAVINITGIPAGSTVSMTEQNTTPDTYKTKAGTTSGGTDLLAEAIIAIGGTTGATSTQTFTTTQNIYLTNTLEAISPTGVVMRFAPFAIILAAGMMLLVLSRKSRKAED